MGRGGRLRLRLCGWAVAGALLLVSARAGAARPPQISVIRAEGADPIILEITNRTRAELIAAGLDAAIVDCSRAAVGCTDAIVVAADGTPNAVVMTARDGDETVTEVKVAAPKNPSLLVLRLTVGADSVDRDDAAALAVRAAELVRSALLQASAAGRGAAKPPSEEITYDFEQPGRVALEVDGVGWFAGAAAAMMGSTGGLSTGYGPALRGGYAGVHWPELTLALSLAAPVWSADLHFDEGRVILRRELAALQASWRFRVGARLQPRISVGVGIYHLGARGVAAPGSSFVGQSTGVMAPLATSGGGLAFTVVNRLAVFVDMQALFVRNAPQLVVAGGQPINEGAPSFLASAGIENVF